MRTWIGLVFLGICALPLGAQAQLTIAIDGQVGGVDVHAQGSAGVGPAQEPIVVAPPQQPSVPQPPVVFVHPDAPRVEPAQQPIEIVQAPASPPAQPANPPGASIEAYSPPPPPRHDDTVEGWGTFGGAIDFMSLDGMPLAMGNPEISVLQGARLDQNWAGMAALRDITVGSATMRVGSRTLGILRGPELAFSIGGADLGGPFSHVNGTNQDLDVAPRSLVMLRAELSIGVQAMIGGFFIPYAMLRASAGAYWLGVEVQHRTLGSLGGEVLDNGIYELGGEVGFNVRVDSNFELQMGVRGNFLGPPSVGLTFGLAVGGT